MIRMLTAATVALGLLVAPTGALAQTANPNAGPTPNSCAGRTPTIYVYDREGKVVLSGPTDSSLERLPNGGIRITGTEGDDVIDGSLFDDIIDARGGNDVVCARAGNDQVFGGLGRDTVRGGLGNDFVDGGADTGDIIDGQEGTDTCRDQDGAAVIRNCERTP